jgi:hypothetical protein
MGFLLFFRASCLLAASHTFNRNVDFVSVGLFAAAAAVAAAFLDFGPETSDPP